MRLRVLALAVALGCGFGTLAEAKQKPPVHIVKRPKSKAKKVKRPKAPKHAKVKHARRAA
jgi:hypothetical protein